MLHDALSFLYWGVVGVAIMFIIDYFRFHKSKLHDKENRRK